MIVTTKLTLNRLPRRQKTNEDLSLFLTDYDFSPAFYDLSTALFRLVFQFVVIALFDVDPHEDEGSHGRQNEGNDCTHKINSAF